MIDNDQRILISRSKFTETSRATAVLRLNTREFKKGELVMLNYHKNQDFRDDIGVLVAIGVRDGVGETSYKIINSGGEVRVRKVTIGDDNLPDVSLLTNGELYIHKGDDEVWNYVFKRSTEPNRTITPISKGTGPFVFLELETGYRWFYDNQTCKREDDFFNTYDTENILQTIVMLDISVSVSSEEGYVFKEGTINSLTLDLHAYDKKRNDVSSSCKFFIDDTEIVLGENNKYLLEGVHEDRDYIIEARYRVTDNVWVPFYTTMSVKFGYNFYYGIVNEEWDKNPLGLSNVKLNYRRSIAWEKIELKQESVAFCYPKKYGYLSHIYDVHGLDYLHDYKIYDTGVVIDGESYLIYKKEGLVTTKDFEQNYVFNDVTNLEVEEDNLLSLVSAWKKKNLPDGLVLLGGDGKIPKDLYQVDPSSIFRRIKDFVNVFPSENLTPGDIYYNPKDNTIFTAISGQEGVVSSPKEGEVYVFKGEFYSWNGKEFSHFSRGKFSKINKINEVTWLK